MAAAIRAAALESRLIQWQADADPGPIAMALATRRSGYSDRNACLIAMQDPEATDVFQGSAHGLAGAAVSVEGEAGIMILAPAGHCTRKGKDGGGARGSHRGTNVLPLSPTFSMSGKLTSCLRRATRRAMNQAEAIANGTVIGPRSLSPSVCSGTLPEQLFGITPDDRSGVKS